MIVINIFWQH